ncbi:MAG: GAF domain-containing protein [Bacteroidota bacterium]
MRILKPKLQRYTIFLHILTWLFVLIGFCVANFGWYFYCSRLDSHYETVQQDIERQRIWFQLMEPHAELAVLQRVSLVELSYTMQRCGEGLEKLSADLASHQGQEKSVKSIIRQLNQHWGFLEESIAIITSDQRNILKEKDLGEVLVDIKELQRVILADCASLSAQLHQSQDKFRKLQLGLMSVLLIATLFSLFKLIRILTRLFWRPVQQIHKVAQAVAAGDLSQRLENPASNELGQVARAIDAIIQHQLVLTNFVENIGNGQFNVAYQPLSQSDRLGISLMLMRDKLLKVSMEEKRQSWANEGYAKFADILRNNGTNIQCLADNLLPDLVKYLGANQGAFFILNDDDPTQVVLTRAATYAWERRKMVNQQLNLGEGLIGQAAREGDILHLTDLPTDYTTITSGLGRANPSAVLIVPLKANDIVKGVLELATLKPCFEAFEIEFIGKLAESMAATLATVRTSEHTQRVLAESRQLNEHLTNQEEILRQSTEEMYAVQEELRRKSEEAMQLLEVSQAEMKEQISQIEAEIQKSKAILEECVDGVISFEQHGKVVFFNKAAEEIWGVSRVDILNKSVQTLFPIRLEMAINGFAAFSQKEDKEIAINIRTEIVVHRLSGGDLPVLLTITQAEVGQKMIFTAFIQRTLQ